MQGDMTPEGKQADGSKRAGKLSVGELSAFIMASLEDDKAEDLICYDLIGRTSLADYMIFASGKSSRQVVAMAGHLRDKLAERGTRVRMEGIDPGDWVLVDAGDIIVHLFCPEAREMYQLEEIWSPDGMERGDDPSSEQS